MVENTIVNKELVNFKIPVDLKRNFISLCKLKGCNMTFTITEFIKQFVVEESKNIKIEMKNMKEVETMISGVRGKISKKKDDDIRMEWLSSSY